MALVNDLSNSGFEDATDWVFGGNPASGYSSVEVYEGSQSDRIVAASALSPPNNLSFGYQTVDFSDEAERSINLWVNGDDADDSGGTDKHYLRLEWRKTPASVPIIIAQIRPGDVGSGWRLWTVGNFTPTGGTATSQFYIRNSISVGMFSIIAGSWYVDNVFCGRDIPAPEADVAFTKSLRDALVLDLQAINTTDGYDTAVAEVSAQPKPIAELSKPFIQFIPGSSGDSDIAALGNQSIESQQNFTLQIGVRAGDLDAIDNLTDDVRNCIERDAGNLKTLANVYGVIVTSWDEIVTDRHSSGDIYLRTLTVTVRYAYRNGSA